MKTILEFSQLKVGKCYKWNSIMSESIWVHDDGDESKANWPVVGLLREKQHFILLGKYQTNQHYDRLWILAPECDGDVLFDEDDIRRLIEVET